MRPFFWLLFIYFCLLSWWIMNLINAHCGLSLINLARSNLYMGQAQEHLHFTSVPVFLLTHWIITHAGSQLGATRHFQAVSLANIIRQSLFLWHTGEINDSSNYFPRSWWSGRCLCISNPKNHINTQSRIKKKTKKIRLFLKMWGSCLISQFALNAEEVGGLVWWNILNIVSSLESKCRTAWLQQEPECFREADFMHGVMNSYFLEKNNYH